MNGIHRALRSLSVLIVILAAPATQVAAGDITLAWDVDSDPTVTGYKIHCGTSSGVYGSAVDVGNQTTYPIKGLGAGTYYFAVTAYNGSGQESGYSNEVSTTILSSADVTPPSVRITVPTSSASWDATSATLTVAGTASDSTGVSVVTWSNAQGGNGTASGTSSWSVTGIPLQTGTNAITIRAMDPAGNAGTAALTVTYAPDATAPSVSITSPATGGNYSASTSPLSISGTASDNVRVAQVSWNNDRGGAGTASGTSSWTVGPVALQSGTNTVSIKAADAAGNVGTATLVVTYTPDLTAPTVSIAAPSSNGSYSTTSSPITIAGGASDNMGVTQVSWSNAQGGSGNATGTTSWSVAAVALQTGSNVITITAKDSAGNAGTASITVTYTSPDKTAPAISGVTATQLSKNSVKIQWSTNESANSQVNYGSSSSYQKSLPLDTRLVTLHSQTISGLNTRTRYHYRVKSRDAAGNLAVSGDYTFTLVRLTASFFPQLSASTSEAPEPDDAEYSGVAVINNSARSATVMFTAFDKDGNRISGDRVANPVSRVLTPGEQLPIVDIDLFGDRSAGKGGWFQIDSDADGISGLFMAFNDRMTELDGAALFNSPMDEFVFPEIKAGGPTIVNLSNANDEPVSVTLELMKKDGGPRAATSRIIAGHGMIAAEVSRDLFNHMLPDVTDYIRVRATGGVIPLELLGRRGTDISLLSGLDTADGSETLYSPQYAVGGPWRTALSLINLSPFPGTLAVTLFRDGSLGPGIRREVLIPASGKTYIDDPGFFGNSGDGVIQGYAKIETSGIRITGSVTFGCAGPGECEAALPLVSTLRNSLLFGQVASTADFFTGIALVNPNDADANVEIDLYTSDGLLQDTRQLTIAAQQRKSGLLTQFFGELAGQSRTSGYIRIRSDLNVAGFALFGTHSLSVISAIPSSSAP